MIVEDEWVWVYDYEYWDPDTEKMARSTSPATAGAIKAGLGIPLLHTGRKLRLRDLDDVGRARSD